jgi:hypothetical protein
VFEPKTVYGGTSFPTLATLAEDPDRHTDLFRPVQIFVKALRETQTEGHWDI